jgi:hypothetical protein
MSQRLDIHAEDEFPHDAGSRADRLLHAAEARRYLALCDAELESAKSEATEV